MVTFGGAYAVLPYVSQQAVETYGWLTAGQMLERGWKPLSPAAWKAAATRPVRISTVR